ncbi:replicative DNA helicase [Rubellicoccus peritrichatus]|uniref:DNA 5'-3' helicase n=1 Tax=Rubellicoccus peritrichatus TaxID=3080537 RepID=A0AAQ3LC97_9BACT|nr:DnaB-like helicase C-terminal domain-containing protein [Puniceicoccus sp. CR14]WOO43146.1 DnaB-like helicase C-terminal domain-containing protein [Puniceicoccus sp. CR14]
MHKVYNKPPHNIELEQALLACILLEGGKETMPLCVESDIHQDVFYSTKHQLIWNALLSLYKEGVEPLNEIFLTEQLNKTNELDQAGGDVYFIELTNRIDTHIGIQHYIDQVREHYLGRQIIRAGTRLIESVYDGVDGQELVRKAEKEVFGLTRKTVVSLNPIGPSVTRVIEAINGARVNRQGAISGVRTGLYSLDRVTGGFRPGQLIVAAAGPKEGKSSLMLRCVDNTALPEEGEPGGVLIFSMEMQTDELTERLIAYRGYINLEHIKEGFTNQDAELVKAAHEVEAAPIWINDTNLDVFKLRTMARRHMSQHPNTKLICVDYLGLFERTSRKQEERDRYEEATRECKKMAQELNVPVLLLAQLNRAGRKEGQRPHGYDIKFGSGAEADADKVILIYTKKDGSKQVIVDFQRNGTKGDIDVDWTDYCTRFDDKGQSPASLAAKQPEQTEVDL